MKTQFRDTLIVHDVIAPVGQKILSISANSIGNESIAAYDPLNPATSAVQYMLKGVTPEIVRMIKNGEAYMVFEMEAIDHSKPTANNKLYPMDIFAEGMNCYTFQNQMRLGGVKGEYEHPFLKINTQDPQAAFIENMNRIRTYNQDTVTHRVIGYRQANNKTYFIIKTSLENPIIAIEMLNGNAPGFSIRTVGDFDNESSPIVAKKIEVLGIDYVSNPANWSSAFTGGTIELFDTVNCRKVNLELVQQQQSYAAVESEAPTIYSNYISNESQVYIDDNGGVLIRNVEKKDKSFKDVMTDMMNDIL